MNYLICIFNFLNANVDQLGRGMYVLESNTRKPCESFHVLSHIAVKKNFIYIYFVTTFAIERNQCTTPSRGKGNSRQCKTTTSRGRRWKREKNGNATWVNSNCGPIHHMMGAKVCTSINFPYLLKRGGKNDVYRVSYDSFYHPLMDSQGILQSSNNNLGVSFNDKIFKLQ